MRETLRAPSLPARARRGAALLLALLLPALAAVMAQRASGLPRAGGVGGGGAAQGPEGNRAGRREGTEPAGRARLVLLIVVDQFRYDYLERFGDLFGQGGLRRLQRDGASWVNADYDHIPTETAPGHATLLTGAWPAETGIIANDWYDRARGRRVNNVEDETARLVGPGGQQERAASPRAMLASTLGDELKLATRGRSKVFGISAKDRGAVLPAGRGADGAFWYSVQTGQFVSSSYYADQLPAWVARYNEAKPADKYFGSNWERLLPAAEYERRAGADDAPWEKGEGNSPYFFPYALDRGGPPGPGSGFYNFLLYSPYTNDMLVRLAEQAIEAEGLGADADTDVLSVSFSANDYVGHRYGPYSHEVMDITLRTDRQVEQLLNFVDARVGLRNTLVVFTSDHGVAPIAAQAAAEGLPGGIVNRTGMLNAIRNRLRARFGKGERDNTADYVVVYSNGQLYFNHAALERDGVSPPEAERVAGEAALTVPGVMRYFTRTQLQNGSVSPADPVARRALHGYSPARSGDVIILQEPFKYITDGGGSASHGTPYGYDTRVPVVVMGAGLVPGRYAQAATPADIAPTLAHLLRVQAPSNATGRVLAEALR